MSNKEALQKQWLEYLGKPSNYDYESKLEFIRKVELGGLEGEIYQQANGPGTYQQVLLLLPEDLSRPCPAVVVPFYYPDKAAGHDLQTLEPLENQNNAIAYHLAKRGYITITAESYHLTYGESERGRDDFGRWQAMGEQLQADHPTWSGVGKLVHDTRLLLDVLEADPRVDATRIGMAGHSLGGKMTLYTACLDERVKVMLASDFGLAWDRSNWSDVWYWGEQLDELIAEGVDHRSLLQAGGLKPLVLIAGHYDGDEALTMMEEVGYDAATPHLFINHATGHRPPMDVLERGYAFLDEQLR